MSQDNDFKPEQKKGFPGGFLLLLVAAVLALITFQNMSAPRSHQVGFSYQVEHLVNLDLVQPEDSKKIALNDNLVTFTGEYRDVQTDTSKNRYRYLELLNQNDQLKAQMTKLSSELSKLKPLVLESVDFFYNLTGFVFPKNGAVIVDASYDLTGYSGSLVLKNLSDRNLVSLVSLKDQLQQMQEATSLDTVMAYNDSLIACVQNFRSPVLGIGDETIKSTLKNLEIKLYQVRNSQDVSQAIQVFSATVDSLYSISTDLLQKSQGVQFSSLRNVKSYLSALDSYKTAQDSFEANSQQLDKARTLVNNTTWYFNNQELTTAALEKQDPDTFGKWFLGAKAEMDAFNANKGLEFRAPDQPRNLVLDKTFKSVDPAPNYASYIITFLPVLIVGFFLYYVFSRQMKGSSSGAMTFGKSPAKLLTKEKNKVTFKDVAGCDESKEELQEIVDFLKDPAKFTALGARIPKGVLCIGAPGTGKTLIAKAVAGEADRPFFSISGSDFVEMFVGVGASRIRDMFAEARKFAPCIIFIDEIDAVGRHRGSGIGGGHDEREQTLNQLLVEMDGFDTSEGIIIIAATNRPDVLDKALLRPGRFDRRIVIDLPDLKGRFEILKVHARRIKLDPSVDLMDIARVTPGASGADLANVLNEAALLAARRGRSAVTAQETSEACDKVRYGKERKSLEVDQNEKKTTAFHEAGHAIVALKVKHSDLVDKVTVIPRGMSLGATHFMPLKNRVGYWKQEALDKLAILMGGRAAEEIFVQDMSSGAQGDIIQATRLARSMVCEWGMTSDLGLVAYDERSESGQYLGGSNYQERTYSEETAKIIDKEVKELIEQGHRRAIDILNAENEKVVLMTEMLMKYETLDRQDVLDIMSGAFSVEAKDEKLKQQMELHKKSPPPLPTQDNQMTPQMG
jgi:cell division protease FtsH